jgi:hypothetical protein
MGHHPPMRRNTLHDRVVQWREHVEERKSRSMEGRDEKRRKKSGGQRDEKDEETMSELKNRKLE